MPTTTNIARCFGGRFANRTVLVTGHTGFKGSWLCLWLQNLGANVIGYSLPAPTTPSHFDLLNLDLESHLDDVRDLERLRNVLQQTRPELVLHLAAQPLVRLSYDQPVETFTSNINGTLNVLEAARGIDSIRAVVCVTSDKVYENYESDVGYQETDRVGGSDPYSASKGCCELIARSYRDCFFPVEKYGQTHQTLIATARAGNVFGGGDWAQDRLVPDAVKAASSGQELQIRSPNSIRPWQHVLEPLAGYLVLADRMLREDGKCATAWNFGPNEEGNVCVADLIDQMKLTWPAVTWASPELAEQPHETHVLKLDSSRARQRLNWLPVWNWQKSIQMTTDWYRAYCESGNISSQEDLEKFITDATNLNQDWTK